MIVETFLIAATNTDILIAPSRLAAIPYAGTLVLEMQSTASSSGNNVALTVQLPDGSTPMDGQIVPEGAVDNTLNADDKYTMAFPAQQGGHFLLQTVVTGTAGLRLRVTLTP